MCEAEQDATADAAAHPGSTRSRALQGRRVAGNRCQLFVRPFGWADKELAPITPLAFWYEIAGIVISPPAFPHREEPEPEPPIP